MKYVFYDPDHIPEYFAQLNKPLHGAGSMSFS
jgi:hypothetical protein